MNAFANITLAELRRRKMAAQRVMHIQDAEKNLLPYVKFTMPIPRFIDDSSKSVYEAARHHEVIALALEGLENGTYKNLIINCPPRHGKSELSSRKFIPWFCGRNPGKSIVFASYSDEIAEDFGSDVMEVMDSPQHAQVFPNLFARPGQKAKDHIGLSTGGDMFFVGRGGSLTSRGGDGLVLDDPFKDDSEAGSKLMRDKAWSWFNKTFLTRRMYDDSWVCVIQTRWHEDDITGRLTDPKNEWYSERQAKQWHIIDLPALAVETDDPLGRQPGEALWPARFNRRYLLDAKEADAQGFQSLYQGRPAPDDGLFFLASDLKQYSRGDRPPNEELTIYMAADYAVATDQHNDRSVILVVGVDNIGRIWVFEDSFIGRVPSDRAVEITVGLIKKFRPQFLWGEKGQISKSLGPFMRARMREERAYTTLVDLTSARDKKTKAQAIKGRSSQGLLRLPRYAPWTGEVMEELLSFPKGRHDDFVDALSFIGLGLDVIAPGQGAIAEAETEAPGSYGYMMARSNELRRARGRERRYW